MGNCFKKHSLRAEDDGVTTYIIIMDSDVEIISPSGTTSTSFDEIGTFKTWIKELMSRPPSGGDIKGRGIKGGSLSKIFSKIRPKPKRS